MLLSDVAKQLRKATVSLCVYVHQLVQPSVLHGTARLIEVRFCLELTLHMTLTHTLLPLLLFYVRYDVKPKKKSMI